MASLAGTLRQAAQPCCTHVVGGRNGCSTLSAPSTLLQVLVVSGGRVRIGSLGAPEVLADAAGYQDVQQASLRRCSPQSPRPGVQRPGLDAAGMDAPKPRRPQAARLAPGRLPAARLRRCSASPCRPAHRKGATHPFVHPQTGCPAGC